MDIFLLMWLAIAGHLWIIMGSKAMSLAADAAAAAERDLACCSNPWSLYFRNTFANSNTWPRLSAREVFFFSFHLRRPCGPPPYLSPLKTLLSLRRAYLFYRPRPRDEFLSCFPSFTMKKNNIYESKYGWKWRCTFLIPIFFFKVSLRYFVLLQFGNFWKIRSKRLLCGRPSAAQAEQLPGQQSVHFFSLN